MGESKAIMGLINCTCDHEPEEHGWGEKSDCGGGCEVEGCDCEGGWEE